MPRQNVQTQCYGELRRPALRIQGCSAHGFGYWFAVVDQDAKRPANNDTEVVSRALDRVHCDHGGSPLGLFVQ
eukprot:11199104-Lingulodinium_polyedra.AAC.1